MEQRIIELSNTIARTDNYLHNANNKSTILLSLASAILAVLYTNYEGFITKFDDTYLNIISFIMFILLTLFLAISIYYSLKPITPYLKPSTKSNTHSFLDILHFYPEKEKYLSAILSLDQQETITELAALHFNLSQALKRKYEDQIKAIFYLKMAIAIFCIISIQLIFFKIF